MFPKKVPNEEEQNDVYLWIEEREKTAEDEERIAAAAAAEGGSNSQSMTQTGPQSVTTFINGTGPPTGVFKRDEIWDPNNIIQVMSDKPVIKRRPETLRIPVFLSTENGIFRDLF